MDAIYIHIPFCIRKCSYCDFLSFSGTTSEEREKYVEHIIREIKLYPEFSYDTVYFGGGTPSILTPEQIERIIKTLKIMPGAEVTLETNPKTVDLEKLKQLREAGINRLSIGIQSFNEKHLKNLGRLHTTEEGESVYKMARAAGLENISLDLMFSLPEESLEEVKSDLDKLFALEPEHFSIYSLIWEEGTEFMKKLEKGEFSETENEIEAEMYNLIIDESRKNGYTHYEISNFSKPGKEARHNSKYWRNMEYLGIGIGASGYLGDVRYKNVTDAQEYYTMIDEGKRPVLEEEIIDSESFESYRNILGLRLLNEGVHPSEEYRNEFEKLEAEGYLRKENERFLLTEKGIFFANDVFSRLV